MLQKVHVCEVISLVNSRNPQVCPPFFNVFMCVINVLMHKFSKKWGSYPHENVRYDLFVHLSS